MSFTDSSCWQDNAILGVCADRQIPSELSVFGLGQMTGLEQSQDLGRQSVCWVRLFPSGVAILGPLQQWLSSLIPGVPICHISFHRQFGTSFSLRLQNPVFPPGGNEGSSFVLGFWDFWDYLGPFDPFKVECLIPTYSDRMLYLLQVQELHFIFVLQMRAMRRHWLLCSLLDTVSVGWNHLESKLTV